MEERWIPPSLALSSRQSAVGELISKVNHWRMHFWTNCPVGKDLSGQASWFQYCVNYREVLLWPSIDVTRWAVVTRRRGRCRCWCGWWWCSCWPGSPSTLSTCCSTSASTPTSSGDLTLTSSVLLPCTSRLVSIAIHRESLTNYWLSPPHCVPQLFLTAWTRAICTSWFCQ